MEGISRRYEIRDCDCSGVTTGRASPRRATGVPTAICKIEPDSDCESPSSDALLSIMLGLVLSD